MATTGKVKIELDNIGRGKVYLNDIDISRYVRGITVSANVGELTEVELRVLAGVEINIETSEIFVRQIVEVDNTSVGDNSVHRLMLKTGLEESSISTEYAPLELETFAIKYREAKKRGLI